MTKRKKKREKIKEGVDYLDLEEEELSKKRYKYYVLVWLHVYVHVLLNGYYVTCALIRMMLK